MSAIDPAHYQEIIIESNDGTKSVDIRVGVLAFRYYEDLFSPTITAKMIVVNTGGTVPGDDSKYESLYSGLPIRGGERLTIKIAPNLKSDGKNPVLDFASKPEDYFYVSGLTNVLRDGQKEIFVLDLVSRESITNETTRVPIKFPRDLRISESARKIAKDYLKTEIEVDDTQNQYGFYGNLKRPFTLLVWLASKAVPTDGLAGFFFYQTKSGLKFKSVDKLISEGVKNPKATYTHSEAPQSPTENDDFKILNYNIERNNDLLKKLRLGTYSSFFAEFNPLTSQFTLPQQGVFNLNDYTNKTKNLGGDPEIPRVLSDSGVVSFGSMPSRIVSCVADVGTMEKSGASTAVNGAGSQYQRQALMRYNLLFMQQLTMTVPVNTDLEVGDIIRCNFLRVSATKEYDRQQSGLYMIKELCHSFDGSRSLTTMKLIRDTYGEFGNA